MVARSAGFGDPLGAEVRDEPELTQVLVVQDVCDVLSVHVLVGSDWLSPPAVDVMRTVCESSFQHTSSSSH